MRRNAIRIEVYTPNLSVSVPDQIKNDYLFIIEGEYVMWPTCDESNKSSYAQ